MPDRKPDKDFDQPLDPVLERRIESWLQSKANSELSSRTQQRILAVLSSSLAPVKPLPSQGKLILAFLGIFLVCVAAIVPMTGWMGIHLMTREQTACMFAIFATGAILFAFTLASQMVPGSATRFPLTSVLALSSIALIGGMALLFPWRLLGKFAAEGWPCAVLEIAVAVPVAGVVWLVVRRGAPFRSPGLGAAVGGLSVFLALTVVQSQCMFQQAPHLLVWHGGIAALLIASGAVAGAAARRLSQ